MTDKVDDKPVEEPKVEAPKVEDKPVVDAPKLTSQEESAISYGWMLKEDWVKAGHAEDDWVPAKHFLRFGELKNQVISKDKQVVKQDKIIKMMKDHHLKVKQTAFDEAMSTIKAERKAALDENDIATAERLRDKMDDLKEKHAKAKALPAEVEEELKEPIPAPPSVHPDFHDWHSRNSWYIRDTVRQDDMSKTADRLGVAIVQEMQSRNEQVDVKAVYREVEKEIKKLYPTKFSTPKSPQQDGSGKTSGKAGGSGIKLSEDELQVAKNFGMTPEKYAEQLKTYKGR